MKGKKRERKGKKGKNGKIIELKEQGWEEKKGIEGRGEEKV